MTLWERDVGDRIVISPYQDVDTRKPVAERVPYTPTVRQLLYGASAESSTRNGRGCCRPPLPVDRMQMGGFGGKSSEFVYYQPYSGFEPDRLLTLDESPNDWYGSFQRAVVTGLRAGKRNALFQRITGFGPNRSN